MLHLRPLFICLVLTLTIQVDSACNDDLKSIFRTPKKDHDQFEILKRSNFDLEDANTIEKPKSFANAQVSLRFGCGDNERRCRCGHPCPYGHSCQYRYHFPHYYPVLSPIPYYFCVPRYPYVPCYPSHLPHLQSLQTIKKFVENPLCSTGEDERLALSSLHPQIMVEENLGTNQIGIVQNNNILNEIPQVVNNVEIMNNHPQILNTVKLSEEVFRPTILPFSITNDQIEGGVQNVEYPEEMSNNDIQSTSIMPNVKLVDIDLNEAPKPDKDICELANSLVMHTSPRQQEPKLLVTYPIFNRPQNEVYRSGYCISGASGYYTDPVKTVIYRKPTVLSIIGPESVLRPQPGHGIHCPCRDCAKYVGELNETGF